MPWGPSETGGALVDCTVFAQVGQSAALVTGLRVVWMGRGKGKVAQGSIALDLGEVQGAALIFVNDGRGGRGFEHRGVGKIPNEGPGGPSGNCVFSEESVKVVQKL